MISNNIIEIIQTNQTEPRTNVMGYWDKNLNVKYLPLSVLPYWAISIDICVPRGQLNAMYSASQPAFWYVLSVPANSAVNREKNICNFSEIIKLQDPFNKLLFNVVSLFLVWSFFWQFDERKMSFYEQIA